MAMQGMEWPEQAPVTERNPVPYVGLRDVDDDPPTLKSQRVPTLTKLTTTTRPWFKLALWTSVFVGFAVLCVVERHPLQALGVLLLVAANWWLVRDVRVRGAL